MRDKIDKESKTKFTQEEDKEQKVSSGVKIFHIQGDFLYT